MTPVLNPEFVGLGQRSDIILTLKSELPFGKHEGETLEEVIYSDINYAEWFEQNVTGYSFDRKAKRLLQEMAIYEDEPPDDCLFDHLLDDGDRK